MVATIESTVKRIPARHPIREAFAGCSSGQGGEGYFDTKGHAVNAFDDVLREFGCRFALDEMSGWDGDEGWNTLRICNAFDCVVGYARLSWYRLPSGRYEFTGYIA